MKHENPKDKAALNGAAIRSEVVLPRVPWALSHLGMIHTGVQEVIDTNKQTNKKVAGKKKPVQTRKSGEKEKRKERVLQLLYGARSRERTETMQKAWVKKKVALQ